MIRYVVDRGAPKPIDDVRCRDLAALGLRRDGAYRAGTRAGEVWVDSDGTTMVAVEPLGFGMTVAAQSVLEDGTHGLFLQNRFVAFADIASLTTEAERLEVKEKNGTTTKVSLALVGSAAEIARRWHAHAERADHRDADVSVRRRIAVSDEEELPYRVRVATAEELGDMLLDSAEDKSVRMRAARRLAQSADADADATRVREQVEERVVDPDVRHELRRQRD